MHKSINESPFGEPISCYSRAQAIADGVLVDISRTAEWKEAGFKFPGAMTRAAYAETIEAGGHYEPDGPGVEELILPPGQDLKGCLWDVCWILRCAIKRGGSTDRIQFQLNVDTHGNGKHKLVRLWSLCGPGDNAEPVITIMLEGED